MNNRSDDGDASSPPHGGEITRLLRAARAGDDAAVERLIELAYDELRALARRVRVGRERETLNTTALLHEAYLKLAPGGFESVSDGLHFRRLMARAMRQVLVDAARRRSRVKRGGDAAPVTLDTALHRVETIEPETLLDLDRALEELRSVDERRADVVECRFFGGLDVSETADALGTSTATVKRDWRVARAWLAQAISPC